MLRAALLSSLLVGCGSFGTTEPSPSSLDAATSADGGPADAATDRAATDGSFCEDFSGPYPGAWTPTSSGSGTIEAAFVDNGPDNTTRSFEVSVTGSSLSMLERPIVARTRIHCEHDVRVPRWDDQGYFLGAAFESPQAGFQKWFSYWGHQNKALALFHLVEQENDAGIISEFPMLPNTTPVGWLHVSYELKLGSSPSFSTKMGNPKVEIKQANAVPTDGQALTFKLRIGIFGTTGASTQHKVNIANLCCQPD